MSSVLSEAPFLLPASPARSDLVAKYFRYRVDQPHEPHNDHLIFSKGHASPLYYAILRSVTFDLWFIPAKLIGVILMFSSILLLFFLPWLDRSPVRSARFRPLYKQFFWLLVIDAIVLGYVGAHPPEGAIIVIGQLATAYYFLHFLVIVPLLGKFETPRPVPRSINDPVLKGGPVAGAMESR